MKNVSRLSRMSTSTGKETMKMALNKKQSDSYLSVLDFVVCCVFSLFLLKHLMVHSKMGYQTSAHKRCH